MATPDQIAWLAGLFEGEGSFSATVQRRLSGTGKERIILRFCIAMTDEDVIRKAMSVFPGYGGIRFQAMPNNRKTVWYWTVGAMDQIIEILMKLWPFLLERRREQIQSAFERYEQNSKDRGISFFNPFRREASWLA